MRNEDEYTFIEKNVINFESETAITPSMLKLGMPSNLKRE